MYLKSRNLTGDDEWCVWVALTSIHVKKMFTDMKGEDVGNLVMIPQLCNAKTVWPDGQCEALVFCRA